MASIASLEAELSREQAINRELRYELAEIESGVERGHSVLEDTNQRIQNTLNASAQKFSDSHQKEIAAIELQAEIDKMYVRFKQMELANKKIRECNNKKYYQFANYRTVRKLVQGMMDNLDVNVVSDEVIYKSIEAQHLKTPDYWLTCALIAIMAWKNDERALAERAIQIALQHDRKNSSIFFMLFNLRMDRDDAALKWFYTYQECPLKGSDQRTFLLLFSLMGKTINSSEHISDTSRQEIRNFINHVIQNTLSAQGYSEEHMVSLAEKYYNRMDSREVPVYPLLQKHCSTFSTLSYAMTKARGNIAILEFLKQTANVTSVQRNAFVKNFIDELIAQANPAEKEVYDEIRYNELIIRHEGDVEKAKAEYEATRLHDESELNLIAEMIEWTFTGNSEELDSQGRLNMLVLTREFHEKAFARHTAAYRNIDHIHLPVSIGDYSTVVDFSNPSQEQSKICQFYEAQRDQQIATIKNLPAYIGFGVAAAAAIAAPFLTPATLIGTVIAAGYGGITLLGNRSTRKRFEMECENNIQSVNDVMAHLFTERQVFLEEMASYDQYVEQIQNEFNRI